MAYVHDGPPRISLYTMVNNESGAGAHSALVINASQRVIFDPAGTIKHYVFIEQDDVLYGATPSVLEFYTRAHSRKTPCRHSGFGCQSRNRGTRAATGAGQRSCNIRILCQRQLWNLAPNPWI